MKISFILAASAVLLLLGCKKPSPIVGDWTMPATGGIQQTLHFGDGGALSGEGDIQQNQYGVTGNIKMTGTYTLSEKNLSFKIDNVDASGLKGPAKVIDSAKAAAANQKGTTQSGTIEWKGNDSFVMTTPQGGSVTLTRKK